MAKTAYILYWFEKYRTPAMEKDKQQQRKARQEDYRAYANVTAMYHWVLVFYAVEYVSAAFCFTFESAFV